MAESEKEENSRFMEQRSRRYDNILFSFEENDKQHSFPECRCDYFVSSPKHAFKEQYVIFKNKTKSSFISERSDQGSHNTVTITKYGCLERLTLIGPKRLQIL